MFLGGSDQLKIPWQYPSLLFLVYDVPKILIYEMTVDIVTFHKIACSSSSEVEVQWPIVFEMGIYRMHMGISSVPGCSFYNEHHHSNH